MRRVRACLLVGPLLWGGSCLGAPAEAAADAAESSRHEDETPGLPVAELRLTVPEGVPADERLEADGAVIGRIQVRVQNIFDPETHGEDRVVYRLANGLHIPTRESVIESQLLFASGDRYSARLLEESERLLRENRYIGDVRIHPIRYHDGAVDIEVVTRDTWTLSPKIAFGRRGGENSSAFGIQDTNLLGLGKELTLVERSSVDRDESQLRYRDPQLLGSHVGLDGLTSNNSDGYAHQLQIDRPFFSLDSRWSAGIAALEEKRIDPLYELGEITEQFQHERLRLELRAGWSDGLVEGAARRWSAGFALERDRFAAAAELPAPPRLPQDRELAYPWVGFDLTEDRFETGHNRDNMGRTEDVFLGRQLHLKLGLASQAVGADRDAAIFEVSAGVGFEPADRQTLLLASAASGRWDSSGLRNGLIEAGARYYARDLGRHLFYASLEGRAAHALDLENQLLLGGDNGLRGYPLRYQSGERAVLLTLEQRLYSDWYPLRLVHVGGAVFFDAGRVWGGDALGEGADRGLLRDVGVGLRLASSRSGLGSVLHIDLAFPLDGDRSIDGMQLLIQSKTSF